MICPVYLRVTDPDRLDKQKLEKHTACLLKSSLLKYFRCVVGHVEIDIVDKECTEMNRIPPDYTSTASGPDGVLWLEEGGILSYFRDGKLALLLIGFL